MRAMLLTASRGGMLAAVAGASGNLDDCRPPAPAEPSSLTNSR
jgi:hypothetical protein